MKSGLVLVLPLLLSGCASLWWAGSSEYEVTPLLDASGHVIGCCTLKVHSGKQYQDIAATFEKKGDDYTITLNETQVQAFKGQQIAASAATEAASAAVAAGINATATAVKLIK